MMICVSTRDCVYREVYLCAESCIFLFLFELIGKHQQSAKTKKYELHYWLVGKEARVVVVTRH